MFYLANPQTSVLFLLGMDEDINNETKHKLQQERNTHGDIIQVDGLIEHYDNLTLKTLYTIKFFLQKSKYRISNGPLNVILLNIIISLIITCIYLYKIICNIWFIKIQVYLFQRHLST